MRTSINGRRGGALIIALVAMAIIVLVLSMLTAHVVTQRNLVRHRHRQVQAEWLARAGLETAAARLLSQPEAFSDDKLEIAPDSKLRVAVEKTGDSFVITASAEVGLEGGRPVVREVIARFRRTEVEGRILLERLPTAKK